MNAELLGWRLARARRRAGLSQAELAVRMGTTQSAISRIEAGRSMPSLDVIDRYARAVGEVITLTLGSLDAASDRDRRRQRAREALGEFRFDPWKRDPTPAEARTLEADGIRRDRT